MKKVKFIFLIVLLFNFSSTFSQSQSAIDENKEVVENFLEGFNNPSKIHASISLLAEDYKFSNPMVQLQSKAEFISLASEMGKVLTGLNIIQISGDKGWVAVLYEFESSIPGLEKNIGTEWFRVEEGVIKESRLIYDASEWRKFYKQMQK